MFVLLVYDIRAFMVETTGTSLFELNYLKGNERHFPFTMMLKMGR